MNTELYVHSMQHRARETLRLYRTSQIYRYPEDINRLRKRANEFRRNRAITRVLGKQWEHFIYHELGTNHQTKVAFVTSGQYEIREIPPVNWDITDIATASPVVDLRPANRIELKRYSDGNKHGIYQVFGYSESTNTLYIRR